MAKLRVHELAKELGMTSKELLQILRDQGEFVKAASSSVEPPVVRRIREQYASKEANSAPVKEKSQLVTKKTTAKKTAAEEETKATETKDEVEQPVPSKPRPKPAPKPKVVKPEEKQAVPPPSGRAVPRPSNPFAAAPRPAPPAPRPAASAKPGRDSGASGRGGRRGNKRNAPRPQEAEMNAESSTRASGAARSTQLPNVGPGSENAGRPDSRGRGRGRGSAGIGRGATQGAFGKGGASKAKKRKQKKAKKAELEQQAPKIGGVQVPHGDGSTPLRLRTGASLADFAEKIDCNPASLVTVLMALGEMATANQSLDEDTLTALGVELGYQIQIVSPEDEDRELLESFAIDLEAEELEDEEEAQPRPPVVTVMGHVDHGKTKLLDAIRHTDVVAAEHGGITQHIGAYQVNIDVGEKRRAITFIDTPGHEAFTAMRARGAEVTDIAILVVAADDGVMPQTVEAINHAQAANVPIVVAVNKVDKDGANPDKVRGQLTEYGLVAEEYGGDVMFVNVSAKQRQGIHELLEAVLLTADAALDLKANPDAAARGVAIETKLDKGRGAVATVLIQRGTLRVGDAIVVGSCYGRVRAMLDEYGENVTAAPPSFPVAVLGLTSVPGAGDSVLVSDDDRTARQIADKREAQQRAAMLAKRRKRMTLEDFNAAVEQGKVDTLNLIIKGDVSGAVEALEDSLMKIDVGEEVALRVIHRGVGAITQNDINLASVDNAVVIGFNVRPAQRVAEYADSQGVDMRFYNIIYKAIEDVESALKGMLKPIYEEEQLGTAEIQQVFKSSKFGNIAGCIIRSGTIKRGTKARLVRDGIVVAQDLEISSLRREKDDVTEVREGYECGIGLGIKDIQVGDSIETWHLVEKPRD